MSYSLKRILQFTRWLLIFFFCQSAHASLIFQLHTEVNTGRLLGASNINISGTFYDVSFQDGRCDILFSGCNEQADFIWTSQNEALIASAQLNLLVLTNSALGQFDTNPNLTNGCHTFTIAQCGIFTPFFDSTFQAARFSNSSSMNDFPSDVVSIAASTSTSGNLNTWAVWSSSIITSNSISEPATNLLFVLAVFCGGMLRKRPT